MNSSMVGLGEGDWESPAWSPHRGVYHVLSGFVINAAGGP